MKRSVFLPWFGLFLLPFIVFAGCQNASQSGQGLPELTPTDQASGAAINGEALYTENCASCHGATGSGNMQMLQGRRIAFNSPGWQKTMSDAAIKQTILNGRGMMPAFATTFSEEQLDALVRYVRTLDD